MVLSRIACFQEKGLDILVPHVRNCAVFKLAIMSIEENYLIVDSGGAAYGG